MIRFVEGAQEQEHFRALCRGSAFGCRLEAVANAYGFERGFARFWTSETAAYCLLDGALSAAGMPEDSQEAQTFLGAVGWGELLCSTRFGRALGLVPQGGGPVLAKDLPPAGPAPPEGPPPLLEIWSLLARAGMALDREGFYLDLSHRVRHGAALALGEYVGGRLAGCAVVSAITEGEAVLSALAVEEELRGRGLGSRLLSRVEKALPGKRIYLLREAGRNREFYRKRGYQPVDRWTRAQPWTLYAGELGE